MKKRITNEELSAFLDGEAKHPEDVECQIQRSEETARRYMALSKVSKHVQALPELQARPGLPGRVAASLAESKSNRRLVWPLRATASVMAAIAFVTLLVVTGMNENSSPPAVETAAIAPEIVTATEITVLGSEEELVAELERRLATDASTASFVSGSFYGDPEPVDELPEEILLALAPSEWLETFASLDSTQDYRTQLGLLSDVERLIFVQLLEEYASVEMQGRPTTRKG